MGKTKDLFFEQRQKEFEPFDHDQRFEEKKQFTWFTTEDFRECLNMNLIQLTETLIKFDGEGFKIDCQDRERLIELIDKKEPFYFGKYQLDYVKLFLSGPLDNLKRIYKKYTQDGTYNMRAVYLTILDTEIKKRENGNS